MEQPELYIALEILRYCRDDEQSQECVITKEQARLILEHYDNQEEVASASTPLQHGSPGTVG